MDAFVHGRDVDDYLHDRWEHGRKPIQRDQGRCRVYERPRERIGSSRLHAARLGPCGRCHHLLSLWKQPVLDRWYRQLVANDPLVLLLRWGERLFRAEWLQSGVL